MQANASSTSSSEAHPIFPIRCSAPHLQTVLLLARLPMHTILYGFGCLPSMPISLFMPILPLVPAQEMVSNAMASKLGTACCKLKVSCDSRDSCYVSCGCDSLAMLVTG